MLDGLIGGDSVLTAKGRAYAQQLPEIILPLLPQVRGTTTGGGCCWNSRRISSCICT
jgi:hypothetical protein